MYKRVLFALDMEGVNNVVGEPYLALTDSFEQYQIATHQAVLEVNAAAQALFDIGVDSVDLWDNHSNGHNIVPEELDGRIRLLDIDTSRLRMYFADENKYDCICYFGYHAMEGTLGGVLAHTMSSKENQYYKLNGKYVGEVDIDAYIAAAHGMPSCFFAAGDIACAQAQRAVPGIVTVITKKELSRNCAEFRDNGELFEDIKKGIVKAVQTQMPSRELTYPATIEKSFKRMEDAAKYLERLRSYGMKSEHPDDDILGKDAHTVVSTVNSIEDFIRAI